MAARGGALCAEALKSNSITCNLWRWKKTAESKEEKHCLCGRPFSRTEWRPLGAKRGAATSGGQAKAAAKTAAKAKPGAKAKAKAKAEDGRGGPSGRALA